MYKALIRAGIRTAIRRLNNGDAGLLLAFAADDIQFAFPGNNSWATMFRPQHKGRHFHPTHIGRPEAEAFAQRFVEAGLQVEVEDILVNGPPWNTRVAIRASDHIPPTGPGPAETYDNRYIDFLELRWGRIQRFEVYEDTERTAEWDRRIETSGITAPAASPEGADGGR